MNIDVACAVPVVISALRNQLFATPLCFPKQLGGLLSNVLIDRLDVDPPTVTRAVASIPVRGDDGSTVSVIGHHVRFSFPLHVHAASLAAVQQATVTGGPDPGVPQLGWVESPPPPTVDLKFSVAFELSGESHVDKAGHVVEVGVRVAYMGKDATLPDPNVDSLVDETLADLDRFVPIDAAAVAESLETTFAVKNIGVAVTLDAASLVIRLEVGSVAGTLVQAWEDFFFSPPDHRGGHDWSVMIDQQLIVQLAEERIAKEMAKSKKIEVLEAPTAAWVFTTPGVLLQTYVDVLDKCPSGLSIGAEVTVTTAMTLEMAGSHSQLRSAIDIYANPIDSDVLLCGITVGIAAATLGAVVGAAASPIGAAVGAVIGMIASIVLAAIVADTVGPDSGLFKQPKCTSPTVVDDKHLAMECVNTVELPSNELLGPLTPDELVGHPLGLVLRGSSPVPAVSDKIFVRAIALGWDTSLDCNTHSQEVRQVGGVTFQGARLGICDVEVLDDALKYFTAAALSNKISVTADPNLAGQYAAHPPYPCHLLVRTTRGVRFCDLGVLPPAPSPPDPDDVVKAVAEHCLKAYEQFLGTGFNPKWAVDPGPEDVVLHVWDVAVTGLRPDDALRITTDHNQTLVQAAATTAGAARARVVVLPELDITIQREGPVTKAALATLDPTTHRLAITQSLLVFQRQLPFLGQLREMTSFRGGRRPRIAAVTDRGLYIWSQHPVHGWTLSARARDDWAGIVGIADGVVAYGPDGLWRLNVDAYGSLMPAGEGIPAHVVDVETIDGHVVALADGYLMVFDGALRRQAMRKVTGATGLTTAGPALGVRGRDGVYTWFEVAASGALIEQPAPSPGSPAGAPDRAVLTPVAQRSGGRRVRLWKLREVIASGQEHAPAATWFDTTLVVGGWLVHAEDGEERLRVYRAGARGHASRPWPAP